MGLAATNDHSDKNRKGWRGPAAAAAAGSLEITCFHPVDTVSKRLMSNVNVVVAKSFSQSIQNVNGVVFKGLPEGAGIMGRVKHLYPGTTFAVGYKVSQRVIKFGGQPVVRDYMYNNNVHHKFQDVFGEKKGKMMLEATTGSIVGVSEVILLPIDRMKVLSQTNSKAIGNRSMLRVMAQEGPVKMYAGAVTTAVRNAPGSFLLFGGTAFTKDYVFQLEDYRKATFLQNTMASTVGACVGVFCTCPMDVVKTRIQNKDFGSAKSGFTIFSEVLKHEGPQAFFKGIVPKMITTAPKLVFSYTMTEQFVKLFGQF